MESSKGNKGKRIMLRGLTWSYEGWVTLKDYWKPCGELELTGRALGEGLLQGVRLFKRPSEG